MDTDFVSQADALKFGSKIMVPLTDEEGQKSYVSLPDAIDQLDSKGTLDLFKALYRSEIDNAESEASIVRDLTVVTGEEYLISLGIDSARVNTVSYGKEFPFDPDDTDEAHARNRRAHFVITGR